VPVDFLILATGYALDWHARPEFHALVDQVKTWAMPGSLLLISRTRNWRVIPIWGLISRFRQNTVTAPLRWRCTVLATPALLSNGHVVGLIPGISQGARTLAQHISAALF
jgi:hypothetical protein